MIYVVNIKYGKGPGAGTLIARFSEVRYAKTFIKGQLIEDAKVKVNAFYQLCEGMEEMDVFGPDSIEPGVYGVGGAMGSLGGSGGSEQKSRFAPTPYNATPRPPGSPPNWLKDEEDDKDKL